MILHIYAFLVQTHTTQIVDSIFLIQKPVFIGFLKVFKLPLILTKYLRVEIQPTHTHEFLTFNILLHI